MLRFILHALFFVIGYALVVYPAQWYFAQKSHQAFLSQLSRDRIIGLASSTSISSKLDYQYNEPLASKNENTSATSATASSTNISAYVSADNQPATQSALISEISTPVSSWVVIEQENDTSQVLGAKLVEPGTYTQVPLTLSRALTKSVVYTVRMYIDNGDKQFSRGVDVLFIDRDQSVESRFLAL